MATRAGKTIFETARENRATVLGIARDADLRTAYRAYLEKLKKHRPGSDGAEFARLTAAYKKVREARLADAHAGPCPAASAASEPGADAPLPVGAENQRAELSRSDRKLERPILLARLVKTGVAPERVLECMFHLKTGATDLGRFVDELFLDTPLDVLCALERVRTALAQSAHAPPALRVLPSPT